MNDILRALDYVRRQAAAPGTLPSIEVLSRQLGRHGLISLPLQPDQAPLQLSQLQLQQLGSLLPEDSPQLPDLSQSLQAAPCPACTQLMPPGQDCPDCGYARDSMARYIKESLGSVYAGQYLPPEIALLPRPRSQQLHFVDLKQPGQIRWQVQLQNISPDQALFLPTQQLLITDTQARHVGLYNLLGQPVQTLSQPAHNLQQPVFASSWLQADGSRAFLIVDAAAQAIVILNEAGQLLQRLDADSGLVLQNPRYAYLTADQHLLIADSGRVLAYHLPRKKVLHSFKQELQTPIWVHERSDGHWLVVDAARRLWLHISSQGQLLRAKPLPGNGHLPAEAVCHWGEGLLLLNNARAAWRCRPGHPHLLGHWEDAQAPRHLPAARKVSAARSPAKTHSAWPEVLRQHPALREAPAAVLAMAERLGRIQPLSRGQELSLPAQGLHLLISGQLESLGPEAGVYDGGQLLPLSARRYRSLKPGRLLSLSAWGLRTLQAFAPSDKSSQIAGQIGAQHIQSRVKTLSANYSQVIKRGQPLQPVPRADLLGNLCLYYSPVERQLLTAAQQQGFFSLELHLRLGPESETASQRLALLRTLKSQAQIFKHQWFDNGQVLIARLLLPRNTVKALQERLATQPDILQFSFWFCPLNAKNSGWSTQPELRSSIA